MWSSSSLSHNSRTHRSPRMLSSPWESTSLFEPANGITSFPILTCLRWDPLVPWMEQRSPTFDEDYRRPMTPKRHTQTRRIPEWLSCIRSDHRQAIHLLQHRSKHATQGQLEASKAKRGNKVPARPPRPIPFWVRFSRITELHWLDVRWPSLPWKRPTKEASELNPSSPLSTSDPQPHQHSGERGKHLKSPFSTPSHSGERKAY
jgi:hypothetical protein